jgi:hypothetical protein
MLSSKFQHFMWIKICHTFFKNVMEKKWYILIKLYKMRDAYKFIELVNILISILGIFNYIWLKFKIILIKYG